LFQSLEDPRGLHNGYKNYPIPEAGAIYSPKILVFRHSEPCGYGFMDSPQLMSFVSVAAISRPSLMYTQNNRPMMDKYSTDIMKLKIHTMLAVGLDQGHDSIVLSAFGCGAFACPPYHVASLFKEIIETNFPNNYKNITFAIINDHNSRNTAEGNVKPFAEVFGVPVTDGRKLFGNCLEKENQIKEEELQKKEEAPTTAPLGDKWEFADNAEYW